MSLRIIFMGTPEFAVASLELLLKNNCQIIGVVTSPDKPAGRGQKIKYSAVKEYALQNNLAVLQPLVLSDPNFVKELHNLKPDLFIVVAFRMLPEVVWKIPSKGTFNLHASLLPQYRGAAPINWAIINGETKTGTTTFFIDHKIDTGQIILQQETPIEAGDTAGSLHDKLMISGAQLVLESIKIIEENKCKPLAQDTLINQNSSLKPAPKIHKDTCQINWKQEATAVYNFIRGLSPYPGAWTKFKGEDNNLLYIKVYNASIVSEKSSAKPGSIITDNKTFIHVATENGLISLNKIQAESKKTLDIAEFLKGNKLFFNTCV